MEEKIDNFSRNCVLIALREISGKTDAEIFEAVRRHGYRNNRGMNPYDYMNAVTDLGIKTDPRKSWVEFQSCTGPTMELRRITLGNMIKNHLQHGVYLVRTSGHLFVVRGGKLVDTNFNRSPSLTRQVIDVVKVLNPYRPSIKGYVKVVRKNPCRRGTGHWQRYEEMVTYLAVNKNVTREQLLRDCRYHNADFSWDLIRGNIKII